MMLKNLNIKVYKELNNELEKLWINFEKESDNYYFQTYFWQKYWFKQIQKYKSKFISMHIVVVKNNEEILFIFPFCIKKFSILRTLMWSGFPFSDYNAPLIKKNLDISRQEFNSIWQLIYENNQNIFDCIFLENQPEIINKKKNPFFNYFNTKQTNFYLGIFLGKEFLIKKSQLSDVKYQINRLNKIGDLKFNIAKNKKEKKEALKFIIQNKISQYNRTNAWNLFDVKEYKNFFIQSNLKLDANLSYLTLDKNIIAAHSGYIYNNIFYYLFPVYDENFSKYSPGKILLNFLIKNSEQSKIDYFDFTIGSEEYKKNWSNNKTYSCMTLKSVNFFGIFLVFFIKLKNIIKILAFKSSILKYILQRNR